MPIDAAMNALGSPLGVVVPLTPSEITQCEMLERARSSFLKGLPSEAEIAALIERNRPPLSALATAVPDFTEGQRLLRDASIFDSLSPILDRFPLA